jgi:hypothetical protein
MNIPCPHSPSHQIPGSAFMKLTSSFAGVAGNPHRRGKGISCFFPFRLRLDECNLSFPAEELMSGSDAARSLGLGDRQRFKDSSENGMTTLPCFAAQPRLHPETEDANLPYQYLSVMIDHHPVGLLVFSTPTFTCLRTLLRGLRFFHARDEQGFATQPLEIRLRDRSGPSIYYVDIALRCGRTLEKTLANARGTASRWFRSEPCSHISHQRRRLR